MAGELETVFDGVARFKESIKALQSSQVMVGIPAEEDEREDTTEYGEPITNAALGYINENGQPDLNIPARPFLKPGVKKVQDKIAEEFKFSIKECFNNPLAIEKHNNRAGIIASSSVKATLTQGEGFQPLADSTVRARERRGKKSIKPLIDTGQMRNSITYVIRKK